MKYICAVAVCLFLPLSVDAQIRSGSIAVFTQSKDRFVIAADSRVSYVDGPSDDHECKIAAFESNHVVFAVTGAAGYTNRGGGDQMPSWSALAEARSAVGHKPISPDPANAIEAVLRIADAWDVNIFARWKQEAMLRPEAFRQIVAREKGVLMNGIFAIAYKGQIAFAVSPISKILAGASESEDDSQAEPMGPLNCRFHDLRHTFCSRALSSGVPIAKVAKIVGWSGSTMVLMAKRYGHFSLNELRDAVESASGAKVDAGTLVFSPVSEKDVERKLPN